MMPNDWAAWTPNVPAGTDDAPYQTSDGMFPLKQQHARGPLKVWLTKRLTRTRRAMMQATINTVSNSALAARAAIPSLHEPAAENVIAALVEALSSGEHYELIERGGELFVQPVGAARPVRNAPPAFSPDARARHLPLAA
jgi:hypothetical protein